MYVYISFPSFLTLCRTFIIEQSVGDPVGMMFMWYKFGTMHSDPKVLNIFVL